MANDPSPESEQLVPYLDGELTDAAAAEVEKQLARDPAVRQDVEQLTRTYELLEMLPAVHAPQDFSQKTMTAIRSRPTGDPGDAETVLVSISDQQNGRTGIRWRALLARWSIRGVALFGLLFVTSVGFNSTFKRDTSDLDALLRDFPLIERLNQYREAGSLEFLQQLKDSELFDEHQQASGQQPNDKNRPARAQ